jgi:hypothetical protein
VRTADTKCLFVGASLGNWPILDLDVAGQFSASDYRPRQKNDITKPNITDELTNLDFKVNFYMRG